MIKIRYFLFLEKSIQAILSLIGFVKKSIIFMIIIIRFLECTFIVKIRESHKYK